MRQTLESIRTKLCVISMFLIEADRFLVASRCARQPVAIPDDLLQQYAHHISLFAQIEMQLEALELAKNGTNPATSHSFLTQLNEMEIELTEIYIPTPSEAASTNEKNLNTILTNIMKLRSSTFQLIDPENDEANCAPLNNAIKAIMRI